MHIPYKFINCCSYVCITNTLLFRDILAEKNFRLSTFRHVMLKEQLGSYLANWALIWQWKMSSEVASQCKGNGPIEIFVQVLATGRQKYLLA